MAFKFSKLQIKERDEMVDAARKKLETLNTVIENYNENMAEAWGAVEDALNDRNGALSWDFVGA